MATISRAMSTVPLLPRKLLIQMSGAPGSGKSSFAAILAKQINAVVVDYDLMKSFFLENLSLDQPTKFMESGRLGYRLVWILVEEFLKQEFSVIVDCPCNYSFILENGQALSEKYGLDYRYIECKVDDIDLLDQRLQNRVPLRSQRTGVGRPPTDSTSVASEEEYRARFQKWIDGPLRPEVGAIMVDSSRNKPEELVRIVLEQLVPGLRS